MRVILDDDGNDRHTSLHSKVEGALLERQQVGLLKIRSRALLDNQSDIKLHAV